MPYDYDPNLDPRNQDPNAPTGEGSELAGGSQVIGGSSQTSATPSNQPTKSGSFQNLNDYLDANQGSGFGQTFSDKLQGDVSQANDAQQSAASGFKAQSDAGAVKANPDLVQSAVSNPTSFVTDPNKVSEFTSQRDARYKGPSSYVDDQADYQKAYGATQKAKDSASAAQSEGGRFALLGNYFGRPEYSQGQKSLDNLLVTGDQTAQAGIAQAKANADQAASNFQNQGTGLSDYSAQNKGATEATRAGARGAIGIDDSGAITSSSPILAVQKEAQDKANSINTTNQNSYNQYLNDFGMRKLSPEQLAMTGLSSGQQLYSSPGSPVNLGSYLQKSNPVDANIAATKEQQARVAALSQLAGLENTYLPNASLAGSYDPASGVTFDTQTLNQVLSRNKAAYENALNSNGRNLANDVAGESDYMKANPNAASSPLALQNLRALQQLQEQYGYEDTVNGGTPAGDWSNFTQGSPFPVNKPRVIPRH